jgi:hypothetical protein
LNVMVLASASASRLMLSSLDYVRASCHPGQRSAARSYRALRRAPAAASG